LTFNQPVKAGKIATRKRHKDSRQSTPPAAAPPEGQQTKLQEAAAQLKMEKARLLSELDAVQKELRDWQERSAAEHARHQSSVAALRTEEERLAPVKKAVSDAEAEHGEWHKTLQTLAIKHEEQAAALQRLTAQHDQKAAELQLVSQDEAAARHELEGLANHRDQALAHLQQIRAESLHDETVLDGLRRQIAELEARSQECKDVAEVRADQLKAAEKKLEQLSQQRVQIEAHIQELNGVEDQLARALADCRTAQAQHTSIAAAIAALKLDQQRSTAAVNDLETRITSLQQSHHQAVKGTEEALTARQRAEESLRHLQSELATCEKDLATRNAELADETQRLQQTQARHADLEQQCMTLADTGQKLAGVQSQLAATEQQLEQAQTAISTAESQLTEQQFAVKTLLSEESATKGRIDVLHSREQDLRVEITQLAAAERSQRNRFEEVRQLAADADKEHTAQQKHLASSLASSLAAARSELANLISRLQPLRDWKEAMDQLYARLATLPQDSAEARDLWHEIEKEKAGLHELITTARSQAHATTPEALSHSTVSLVAMKTETPRGTRTGTAQTSGGAQETTLRSRLGHLRESVQREESRLEQLRLERVRHEAPYRASPAAEAMMREQTRQMEAKIRQDQERHHALQRSIEFHQAEEEKRRERLGELERKLAEVRADITEAERQRSELRQQAELARTELKNFEAAIDRMSQKNAN
jgi:chromosome segregation ATPase